MMLSGPIIHVYFVPVCSTLFRPILPHFSALLYSTIPCPILLYRALFYFTVPYLSRLRSARLSHCILFCFSTYSILSLLAFRRRVFFISNFFLDLEDSLVIAIFHFP